MSVLTTQWPDTRLFYLQKHLVQKPDISTEILSETGLRPSAARPSQLKYRNSYLNSGRSTACSLNLQETSNPPSRD